MTNQKLSQYLDSNSQSLLETVQEFQESAYYIFIIFILKVIEKIKIDLHQQFSEVTQD